MFRTMFVAVLMLGTAAMGACASGGDAVRGATPSWRSGDDSGWSQGVNPQRREAIEINGGWGDMKAGGRRDERAEQRWPVSSGGYQPQGPMMAPPRAWGRHPPAAGAYAWAPPQALRGPAPMPVMWPTPLVGVVKDTKALKFANDGQMHLLAKVEVGDDRVVPVDMGVADEFASEVREGDRVAIYGREGTLNARRIIIAERVETPAGAYNVVASADRGLQWCKGTIVDTKAVSLDAGEQALLARVRCEQRGDTIVSLGPKRRLEDAGVSIADQDSIAVLGRPAWVNGEPILIARSVHAHGRVTETGTSMRALYAADDLNDQMRSLRADASASGAGAGDEGERNSRETGER